MPELKAAFVMSEFNALGKGVDVIKSTMATKDDLKNFATKTV